MSESIQKEDWERFRALGNVPPSIREIVLRSWVRSRSKENIGTIDRAPSVAQDELLAIRSCNARLDEASRNVIRRTGYMLDDSGAMLLLCDRSGVIIEAAGDRRILSRGEENHLQPGGRWSEEAIGTNAIGTALHLARPVSINGVEHFCEAIQRWSCSAAPIHDPVSGALLGVIDISGPSEAGMRKGAALSITLALQIEEALRSAGLREQKALIDMLPVAARLLGGDEVMVVDRYGQPVWATGAFGQTAERFGTGEALFKDLSVTGTGDVRGLAERMRTALPEAGVDLLGDMAEPLGVIVTLRRNRLPRANRVEASLPGIAETGPGLAALCDRAIRIVETEVPILIEGPVGSGKETFARALHAAGPLKALPFELVDCNLLTPEILHDRLNTGAGFMRLAETGGTLCLDEPADTAPDVQPLLSRTLAQLMRGGAAPLRLIGLSSMSLAERMQAGALRADLYFQLVAAELHLPGLSERRADLPGLIRRFAEFYSGGRQGRGLRFTPAAMLRLQAHGWPGNLRELRNVIETLSVTSFSRLIDVADLPAGIAQGTVSVREETLRDRERANILDAVAESGGNLSEAARRLGISRSTLYLKLEQYGVPRARQH